MKTLAQVQFNDGWKPRCEACMISVDPRSREYRASKLCSECFDFRAPLIITKGHMIKERTKQ